MPCRLTALPTAGTRYFGGQGVNAHLKTKIITSTCVACQRHLMDWDRIAFALTYLSYGYIQVVSFLVAIVYFTNSLACGWPTGKRSVSRRLPSFLSFPAGHEDDLTVLGCLFQKKQLRLDPIAPELTAT